MRYCNKCVQPDTRPGVHFDRNDICGACLYEEEVRNTIDWAQREAKLREIAEWARGKNGTYDCAIGVSGGKDSTFQALYSRDVLGLHPLLVNSEPEGITEIGKKNIENLKNLGFDMICIRPNPRVMKKLIRRDFFEYMNPVKVTEFSLFASTYIIADKFSIPLIVQGENDSLTLGTRTGLGMGDDAMRVNQQDTLASGWERYVGDGVSEKDLFLFHYDLDSLLKKGIRGIWLQYYTKEWSQSHNTEFSLAHGLTVRPDDFNPYDIGTYCGNFQLDGDLTQVNQMLKFIKFGFGQCTDHACYDIRDGLLTREEAIELVRKYDGKCAVRYIKKFCDYIDIDLDTFWEHAEKFRGPMFHKDPNGQWALTDPIWEQEGRV